MRRGKHSQIVLSPSSGQTLSDMRVCVSVMLHGCVCEQKLSSSPFEERETVSLTYRTYHTAVEDHHLQRGNPAVS